MATACSRKHFLRKTLRQCLHLLEKSFDLNDSKPDHGEAKGLSDSLSIESDFPAALLCQEALRLGLDPEIICREQLLQAVYKVMEKQHQTSENDGGNPSRVVGG